ncbi:MAG: recombinase RecA [Methanomicrobia archaeon]|nr:recombinase RecA [Methanomicrobia archaeon]RLF95179.1 MAG: recombinase RecA [Thermococci archaeon]RLF98383.1 MAG: recombinase RecA [Thermococci archaeon]
MFHSKLDIDVPKGSNTLLSGPPLSGVSTIAKYICLDALKRKEAVIYISTKENGEKIQKWFSERTDIKGLGIVDCISKSLRLKTSIEDSNSIKYVSSSVDLTGVSVKYSNLLERFWNIEEYKDVRVTIDSLSTLLMYSNVQTVFRFLHILTGRVKKIDGYGIFTLDEDPETPQVAPIKQLIDIIIKIEKNKIIFSGFGIKEEFEFEIKEGELIVGGKK